jgi:hypothetical protein
MECEHCKSSEGNVVELSSGLRVHPECFNRLTFEFLDQRFSEGAA